MLCVACASWQALRIGRMRRRDKRWSVAAVAGDVTNLLRGILRGGRSLVWHTVSLWKGTRCWQGQCEVGGFRGVWLCCAVGLPSPARSLGPCAGHESSIPLGHATLASVA